MNARQRRQTRRAGIRLARALLPDWRRYVAALAGHPGAVSEELGRAPGFLVAGDSHDGPGAVYLLRTYRVDGEERYEVLHREPPVHDCPDCAP